MHTATSREADVYFGDIIYRCPSLPFPRERNSCRVRRTSRDISHNRIYYLPDIAGKIVGAGETVGGANIEPRSGMDVRYLSFIHLNFPATDAAVHCGGPMIDLRLRIDNARLERHRETPVRGSQSCLDFEFALGFHRRCVENTKRIRCTEHPVIRSARDSFSQKSFAFLSHGRGSTRLSFTALEKSKLARQRESSTEMAVSQRRRTVTALGARVGVEKSFD